MGGTLYPGGLVRLLIKYLRLGPFSTLLTFCIGLFIALGITSCSQSRQTRNISQLTPNGSSADESVVVPVKAVAALGQLVPSGHVRRLAAPISGFGGSPRVSQLLVREGDQVNKGQILAVFDNRPKILADLAGVRARLKTLEIKILMQEREVSRYKEAALQGATQMVLLEQQQNELVKYQGEINESLAEEMGLMADLANSELKTPIEGVILRIHTRVGERPSTNGVLEVGANEIMEALIEVYESDVNRVQIGQSVSLTSENGGFSGTLGGFVERISPQVRQRNVLSTDPTGDADARVVEVRVSLDSDSALKVRNFTGMKVIARFRPL